MVTRLQRYAWLSVLVLIAACANVTSTKAPDADLSKIRTIYVPKLQGEGYDINLLIVKRLTAMGYEATTGTSETPPQPVDATITYVDRWSWDMAPYLMRLTVQLRDGSTGAILASSESFRPSLERKQPEAMVEECLDALFGKTPKK